MKEHRMYQTEDVRKIMKIGRDKAYALLKSKDFPSIKIGRNYYILEDDFLQWINDYKGGEYKI